MNIILEFDKLYNNGICGYIYISLDILKNLNRNKKLEYISYSLLSLFPKNCSLFETFFENNIKNKIKNDYDSLYSVINEIIVYLENNFLKEKIEENELLIIKT